MTLAREERVPRQLSRKGAGVVAVPAEHRKGAGSRNRTGKGPEREIPFNVAAGDRQR
ncbi:hypothetical protein [Methanoculleus sp. 10]|jgi:hypothetical protein|uniref:hypothetical protein n=1 Tax=Methanoculleus sp. 10 TaxID=430615 RepID=UPI0025D5576C|nr:hypothetical protein [Methanoculleus sp. 10]